MQKLEIVRENEITFVKLGPEFDSIYENTLEDLADLPEFFKTVEPPLVVFDLTSTRFCGSAFLGFLVRLSIQLRVERNGRFGVCHLSKYLKSVVSVSKLEHVIDIFENRSDATKAYAGQCDGSRHSE